jgi:1-aminocyclopropane-1-carboxylate deaminase
MVLHKPHLEIIDTQNLYSQNVKMQVLRLDKIHPIVSGNKIFKLHYFIEACLQTSHKTVLTFGGAFSNHLVATAFACKHNNIKCIGIVRGEAKSVLSHTLQSCQNFGMNLHFVSRTEYDKIKLDEEAFKLREQFGDFILIPEGGQSVLGAKGASLILNYIPEDENNIICTCVGSATTLAGLVMNSSNKIIAVPAIKNMNDIPERLKNLGINNDFSNIEICNEYHFGGFAKYNKALIDFMNMFYKNTGIPTDFIYTAKMFYTVIEKIKANYFKEDTVITCLHTGGLQGNFSLKKGELIF